MDKDASRQYPLSAELQVTFSDTTNTVAADVAQTIYIDLPEGSRVVGGEIVVDTAWVGPTAATIDIGDQVLAADGDYDVVDADEYGNDVNLLSAARTALVLTGYKYASPARIAITLTQTVNVATAGSFWLRVEYVREGRGQEVQT